MRRIRYDRLLPGQDGLLRASADGAPFDGLGYRVDENGRLTDIVILVQGAVAGTSDDWIDLPAGGERVDDKLLDTENTDGPYTEGGVPFTGVGYTFEVDGHCSAEMLYENGFQTETDGREWFPDGALRRLLDPRGTVTAWFADGTLASHVVGADMHYGVTLGADGRVVMLGLADRALLDPGVFARLPFGAEVWLIGSAIDGAVVRALDGLRHVDTLRLVRTGIAAPDLAALAALPALRILRLEDNGALGAVAARQLAAARRDWTVYLDDVPLPAPAP